MNPAQWYDGIWYKHTNPHKIICCDCGLTHIFYHRKRGRYETKLYRDNRATAAVRREEKKRKKRGKHQ